MNDFNRKTVAVIGAAGRIGSSLVEKLISENCNLLLADINKDKLVYAKKFGASSIIKYTDKTNTLVQLKNVFRNELPSVAIETSGNSEAIELCYELSAPAARVILVGVPRLGSFAKIYTFPLHLGKVLKGSYGGESHPDVDIPEIIELISKGILNLNDYPTHMFKLDEINDAITGSYTATYTA
jgi:Zn-dependent alcohol dehydrogenase